MLQSSNPHYLAWVACIYGVRIDEPVTEVHSLHWGLLWVVPSVDFDKCVVSCIHYCSVTDNNITALRYLFSSHPLPSSWATTGLFAASLVSRMSYSWGVGRRGRRWRRERNERERVRYGGEGRERKISYKATVLSDWASPLGPHLT